MEGLDGSTLLFFSPYDTFGQENPTQSCQNNPVQHLPELQYQIVVQLYIIFYALNSVNVLTT